MAVPKRTKEEEDRQRADWAGAQTASLTRFLAYTGSTLAILFFLIQLATISHRGNRYVFETLVWLLNFAVVVLGGASLTTFRNTILLEFRLGWMANMLATQPEPGTASSQRRGGLSLPAMILERLWGYVLPDRKERSNALDVLTSLVWVVLVVLVVLIDFATIW